MNIISCYQGCINIEKHHLTNYGHTYELRALFFLYCIAHNSVSHTSYPPIIHPYMIFFMSTKLGYPSFYTFHSTVAHQHIFSIQYKINNAHSPRPQHVSLPAVRKVVFFDVYTALISPEGI